MPVETAVAAATVPARPRPNKRKAKVRIDKRYALGRRVKALVATFRERLGPDADDPVTQTAIWRTAETIALSEQLRGQLLRGVPGISVDDALRLTRTAEAMTRRLHLDRHKQPAPTPSLQQYLGQRQDDEVSP
jgi:hypothetical protein